MQTGETTHRKSMARWTGGSLLATIIIGMGAAFTVSSGIDVNLTADISATASNMLDSEIQLRAKAYIGGLLFILQAVIIAGLFLLLRAYGPMLAGVSALVGFSGAILSLLGAVFALNAAEIASHAAYKDMPDETLRLAFAGLQATYDYTSFHLGLVLSTVSNAGFFFLFFTSRTLPRLISGWGIFASLFVVIMIVGRDFIPALGHNGLTAAFMLCNLIALVSLGLYLCIRGTRPASV